MFDDLANIVEEIKTQDPKITVLVPGQPGYDQGIKHWLKSSTQQSRYVVVPSSASDLSTVMKVLSKAQAVPAFAVEGGGHIGIPGWSSTPGIHISMEKFNKITINDDTADIGAGCNWDQVYRTLGDKRKGVVGGARYAKVGVAGYTLGGGFSVKSNQYGIGMDTVAKYQVVMPNGYILQNVSANAPNEEGFPVSQLFYALQGGGNNFGIVTSFTLKTHPQDHQVWGGVLTYDPSKRSEFIDAIMKFIQSNQSNPNALADIECGFIYMLSPGDPHPTPEFHASCFFNGLKPAADPFQPFLDVPHDVDSSGSSMNDDGPAPPQPTRGRMDCIMVNGYTKGLIDLIAATAKASSLFMVKQKGRRVYWDVWPFLSTIYQNSSGKSAWPHPPPPTQAYTPIPIFYLWDDDVTPGDKDKFWIGNVFASVEVVKAYAKLHGLTNDDAPIYSNLTLGDTSVQEIYQGNLKELSKLRKLCDPGNVMSGAGGFRIPLAE